jgi:hypothetical protein
MHSRGQYCALAAQRTCSHVYKRSVSSQASYCNVLYNAAYSFAAFCHHAKKQHEQAKCNTCCVCIVCCMYVLEVLTTLPLAARYARMSITTASSSNLYYSHCGCSVIAPSNNMLLRAVL